MVSIARHLRSVLVSLSVLASLQGCGGGGGGGDGGSPGQTYSTPGTVLRTIQLGDQLKYAVSITDADGREESELELTYVQGPNYATANRQLLTIREQAVQSAGGQVGSTSVLDYAQDSSGSIYLIADDEAVIDSVSFDANSLPLSTQSPIGVGASWSYDKELVVSSSVSERRVLNASVTGLELVETRFGRFLAYKVVISETCTQTHPFINSCDVRSSQGTVWIYPPLGQVKAVLRQVDFGFDTLDIEYELVGTNIPVT